MSWTVILIYEISSPARGRVEERLLGRVQNVLIEGDLAFFFRDSDWLLFLVQILPLDRQVAFFLLGLRHGPLHQSVACLALLLLNRDVLRVQLEVCVLLVAVSQEGGGGLVLGFLQHHHAANKIDFALEARLVLVNDGEGVLEQRRR